MLQTGNQPLLVWPVHIYQVGSDFIIVHGGPEVTIFPVRVDITNLTVMFAYSVTLPARQLFAVTTQL